MDAIRAETRTERKRLALALQQVGVKTELRRDNVDRPAARRRIVAAPDRSEGVSVELTRPVVAVKYDFASHGIFASHRGQGRWVFAEPFKDLLLARCVVASRLSPFAKATKSIASKEAFERRCMLTELTGEEKNFVLENPSNTPREDGLSPERPTERDKDAFDVRRRAAPVLAERRDCAGESSPKVVHGGSLLMRPMFRNGETPEFEKTRRHPTEETRKRTTSDVAAQICRKGGLANSEVAPSANKGRGRIGVNSEERGKLLLNVAITLTHDDGGLVNRDILITNVKGVMLWCISADLPRTKRSADRKGTRPAKHIDRNRDLARRGRQYNGSVRAGSPGLIQRSGGC